MDRRTIILVIAIFSFLIVGMFVFAYLNRTTAVSDMPIALPEVPTSEYANITRIDAKHFYFEGVHTYVGEIEFPSPCDLLEASAEIKESMPEQINLAFTVINTSEGCPAVLTKQRFQVSAQASEEALTAATFMGRAVILNLIPALPGETPEDFELFIKG